MTNKSIFTYEQFSFNENTQTLSLEYRMDKVLFTETFLFHHDIIHNYSKEALQRACFGLWVMAGISYYKTNPSAQIQFKDNQGLSNQQKEFFTKTFLHGLGEFFYENNIDPSENILFPAPIEQTYQSISLPNLNGTLIPLGGGKDSLTTIELLKKQNKSINPLSTWSVGHAHLLESVSPLIGLDHRQVSRTICPNLIQANKEGALNGHVPISAILAFTSVISALLTGKKYIALSNENSANHGNTEWKGLTINHQYSKSLEFEKDFQNYLHTSVSPDVHYFSFLRPLSELKIAELFTEHCLEKYKNHFSSCNNNFKLHRVIPAEAGIQSIKKSGFSWCNKCPKCAFVFLILAPFNSKESLVELFGVNLLTLPELQDTFQELLGLKDIKPFECVGEIDECRWAAHQIMDQYPSLNAWNIPKTNFDKDLIHDSSMPDIFRDKILQ